MTLCSYKFLVIDDTHIWRIEGLRRQTNSVIKHPEPVLTLDAPWERGISNIGQNINVIYDDEDGLFKMWYCPRFTDNDADWGTGQTVAYATSRDGIKWEKPIMNRVELNGSRANNCILNQNMAFTMLRDPHDAPSRRYKMIFGYSEESVGRRKADGWTLRCCRGLRRQPPAAPGSPAEGHGGRNTEREAVWTFMGPRHTPTVEWD